MNKVFHFDSLREHYHADAAVIWCFDHRFHQAFAGSKDGFPPAGAFGVKL